MYVSHRMANARAKSEQATNSASIAKQDSDTARLKAKDIDPAFHQPGETRFSTAGICWRKDNSKNSNSSLVGTVCLPRKYLFTLRVTQRVLKTALNAVNYTYRCVRIPYRYFGVPALCRRGRSGSFTCQPAMNRITGDILHLPHGPNRRSVS